MVTLKHDSHDHKLNLTEVDDHMVGKGKCGICEMPIAEASSIYKCLEKDCPNNSLSIFYYLHKTCAELPNQITHPHHPQHLLVLSRGYNQEFRRVTKGSYPRSTACNLCLQDINEQMWNYMCVTCHSAVQFTTDRYLHFYKFALCIRCAIREPFLRHQGHQHHALTLLRRRVSIVCDACGIGDSDICYTCLPCQFWIHSTCAAAPATIKLRFHQDDTLRLIYSIPRMYQEFKKHCSICKGKVEKDRWAYFCEDSGYFVHIRCARTLLASGENEIKYEEEAEPEGHGHFPDLLQFPLPCTDSLVANLLANYQSGKPFLAKKNKKSGKPLTNTDPMKDEPVIKHWSHGHPLILLENFDFEDYADSEDETDYNNIDEMLICNGCTIPISNEHKYYGCIRCNHFLHSSCANHLPLKFQCFQNPKHSLKLKKSGTKSGLVTILCHLCQRRTNGFHYHCHSCSKNIDLICCLLPDKIKHECHKHTLVQCYTSSYDHAASDLCNACWEPIFCGLNYKCELCSDVHIHHQCAMFYPKSIRHRFDSHSISLSYPPIFYKGIKYCEICELQVNPEAWLYRCCKCDQCFHPLCIRTWHNMKLGDTVSLRSLHHHDLTLVMIDKEIYPQRIHKNLCCSQGHDNDIVDMYLQCAGCNLLFCRFCN